MSSSDREDSEAQALLDLGRELTRLSYRFTAVTPATQEILDARPESQVAHSLRDVFGWNRRFDPGSLPDGLFELTCRAGACVADSESTLWRATVRFSSAETC